MNILTGWLSAGTLHALGWTLLHFLWQGTAVAAFTGVLMALRRSAQTRYALAVSGLIVMLASPIVTMFVLTQPSSPVLAHSDQGSPVQPTADRHIAATPSEAHSSALRDASPWLVETWLIGVALFGFRYLRKLVETHADDGTPVPSSERK